MKKALRLKTWSNPWARFFERQALGVTRQAVKTGRKVARKATRQALQPLVARRQVRTEPGAWLPGLVMGAAGMRRYHLYRPPGLAFADRVPLVVMLHGCGQDAQGFAASTRMNRTAQREGFLVLYPEQDRLVNAQGCWNWFDTRQGRAQGEADLIVQAIDQVALLHPVDRARVAIVGLSAGASMAALAATLHPGRFRAVVMHSGVPPGAADSTLSALGAMRGRHLTGAAAARPGSAQAWPALLVIHGDSDSVVAADNGHAAAQLWAERGGALPSAARRQQRGARRAVQVTDFKCRGRTVATWAAVEGLAHAWSGGAAGLPFSDPLGPDATRMVWAFARRQFPA